MKNITSDQTTIPDCEWCRDCESSVDNDGYCLCRTEATTDWFDHLPSSFSEWVEMNNDAIVEIGLSASEEQDEREAGFRP